MTYKIKESFKEENDKVFFRRRRLQDIAYGCDGDHAEDWEEYGDDVFAKQVYDRICDTSRWSEHHEQVFSIGDRFFMTYYSVGATEMQDESPYEYESEWVEVTEVVPKQVTVTKYVAKETR